MTLTVSCIHMSKKPTSKSLILARITRTLYFFIGFFALSIIIFDSGNLITREAVIDRWTLVTVLLILNTIVWYAASQSVLKKNDILTAALTLALLAVAGFMTYWERGMASTSTILYALPLLTVATIKNRHALLATLALAIGTYAFAAVKYFNDFFNEGYRVQLWGTILLISGALCTITWFLMIVAGLRHDSE